MVAAAIRSNNPGASWDDAFTKKWGSTGAQKLNDGTGQGNRIAYFPTKVQGAACQFDRWRNSKHYRNKTLRAAITTWSGGNHVPEYLKFLCDRVPGLTPETVINEAYLSSPNGIKLMKAQAWHEAGQVYPMTDAEWLSAQSLVFGTKATTPTKKTSTKAATTATVATGTAGTVAVAAQQGASIGQILIILGIGVVIGVVAYFLIQKFHTEH